MRTLTHKELKTTTLGLNVCQNLLGCVNSSIRDCCCGPGGEDQRSAHRRVQPTHLTQPRWFCWRWCPECTMKRYWNQPQSHKTEKPAEPQLRIWGLTGDMKKFCLGPDFLCSAFSPSGCPCTHPETIEVKITLELPFEWQAAKYTHQHTPPAY